MAKKSEVKIREQEIAVPMETLNWWKINLETGDKKSILISGLCSSVELALAFRGFAKPSVINNIDRYFLNKNQNVSTIK